MWARLTGLAAPTDSTRPASPQDPQFVRRLLRNLPGMAYRCRYDATSTMEFVSEGCRRLTGFTSHELVQNRVVSFRSLIHAEDQERVAEAIRHALLRGAPYRVTYRLRRVDGTVRWVWEQGVGVRGPSGDGEAVEGLVLDITDRQELAERIAEQESRYRALVEQSLAGVYVISENRLAYVNQRLAEIFGYVIDELVGLDLIGTLVHPEDRPLAEHNLRLRLEGSVEAMRYELRAIRKDGSVCDIEVQGKRIEWEGGPAVMGVLLDITERKRAQRRYHDLQKMEALGRLARGVAHDFNNVLGVIKTHAQLLREERAEDVALADDLDEIIGAVDRGAAIGRQLTDLGRGQERRPGATSLGAAVGDLLPLLTRMIGPTIRVETSLQSDMPPLPVDRVYVEEVIMNLVINAVDAMPNGGHLSLTTRTQDWGADGSAAAYRGLPHAVLCVSDTGGGISPDVRRRIFDPYFTTKGEEGTGLGLTNVWRIAVDAGGLVEVESKPGSGSTFSVYFPLRHP